MKNETIYSLNVNAKDVEMLIHNAVADYRHKLVYKLNSLLLFVKANSKNNEKIKHYIVLTDNEHKFIFQTIRLFSISVYDDFALYDKYKKELCEYIHNTRFNPFDIVDVLLDSDYRFLVMINPKFAKRIVKFIHKHYYSDNDFNLNDYLIFQPRLIEYFKSIS